MSEKSSALRALIAAVAGPQGDTDNRKSWLARAARTTGISFRQIRSIYYGEINDPNHRSARLLRDAAERRATAGAEARAEAVETIRRLLAMRDALAAKDAEFHRPEIDALDCALSRMVSPALPRDVRGNPE